MMPGFNVIVIIVCALLLLILLVMEIRRPNKGRLIWRVLANVIAMVCFALLIIPIHYPASTPLHSTNEMTLLTSGVEVASLPKVSGNKYALDDVPLRDTSFSVISDLTYFLQGRPEIRKIHIYGDGLDEAELQKLNDYEVIYHQGEKPNGIIAANWTKKVNANDFLIVQGRYQNTNKKPIQLMIKGLGKSIDSIQVAGSSEKLFSFRDQPKSIGKTVYQLIATADGDTVVNEPVPFEVVKPKPMKVLMLSSFPDFEYKFLKNWLYQNGYPLAFRSQISKDKFTIDFLNLDRFDVNRMESTVLKKFDVLLTDEETLASLTDGERKNIQGAVDQGLGLIMRISSEKSVSAIGGQFSRFEYTKAKDKPLYLKLNSNESRLAALPIEQSLFLNPHEDVTLLASDLEGRALVHRNLEGQGNVIHTTVSATYQWLLSGNKKDYTLYWSELLSQAGRMTSQKDRLTVDPEFATVNQRIRMEATLSGADTVPKLRIGVASISPRQNIALPFRWDAYYWPKNAGWINISLNEQQNAVYIYKKSEWLAAKRQESIHRNTEYAKNTIKNSTDEHTTQEVTEKQVSLWYFFLLFVTSIGFLWYEAKVLAKK